ncbi:hypothetical protein [Fodinibius sp. Rm-B-1B1-1]|uniref:hypothetical protein n=1 Tax=Fodinibius alkaliphilus TaxID=3140241 RepID=UPI00315A5A84
MVNKGLQKVINVFTVGLFALLTISCSGEQDQTVDQQYLDSQEYNSFKKDTDQEIERSANKGMNIGQQLQTLSTCESTAQITSPATFGWDEMQDYIKGTECQQDQEGSRIIFFGKQQWQNHFLGWFLIEYQSAYRDAEIVVATFHGGQLRSFQTVGVFEKVPAREISTIISISEKNGALYIKSETNRNIKYPLKQENTIVVEYRIDDSGGISEL